MVAEALVFEGNDGLGEFFGYRVGGREAPLPVGGDAGAQQMAVAALQHRTDRVVEQPARTQGQRDEYQHGQHASQQEQILFIIPKPIQTIIPYLCII